MYPATPITGTSATADEVAVGAASAQFSGITMAIGQFFVYCANVDSWILQGANPTASAAAGSMFVPARTQIMISGDRGAKLATIQDSGAGRGSLCAVCL